MLTKYLGLVLCINSLPTLLLYFFNILISWHYHLGMLEYTNHNLNMSTEEEKKDFMIAIFGLEMVLSNCPELKTKLL